ncbi:hypothetical protein ACJRO7_032632 [Eucalyptus globulus]|uniref:Gnk2-homologous domain-containing protein n=1 Tax=Eucalyptus globulus TaxID=34317 RepID=A0ABD3JUB6_EUCGL
MATSNYTKNCEIVLPSLPSDMTSNGGFCSWNLGNSSDIICVLSFCRGDCLDNTCIKCISATAEGLMIKCPNQKAVYSKEAFNPPCFIPYSLVQCTREADISDVYRFMDITMDQDQFDRA